MLAEGLRANGHKVAVCNVPVGFDSTARVAMLHRPWLLARFALRLCSSWMRLWSRARGLRDVDVVVVGWMGYLDIRLARFLFPKSYLVLDHLTSLVETAVDRRAGAAPVLKPLRRLEAAALRKADLICVDTKEHLDELPPDVRAKGVEVWVGAPEAWFRRPPPTTSSPLKVVFFGQFTPLQGTHVIGQALKLLRDASLEITMIGVGQDLSDARMASGDYQHVTWIGWVPSDQLRKQIFAHDICLGIFGTGAKAMRVVPNKVFQGAAAGCAIVTSDTPPQRRALGEAAVYVPAGNPTALAAALRELTNDRGRVDALRSAAFARASERFRPERIVRDLQPHLPTPEGS